MRLRLIVFFIFLGQFSGFGQTIFRDGYVVKNSGDTLNGLVQFEANQKVSNKCIFKRFDVATVVLYSPDMLRGFGYKNGNCYESYNIGNEVIFLECLLKGAVSLYSDGKRLLVHTLSDGFVVLKDKDVYRVDGTKIISISEYLGTTIGSLNAVNVPNGINASEDEILPIVKELNSVNSIKHIVYSRKFDDKMFAEETMLTGANMGGFGIISALNFSNSSLISQTDRWFEDVHDLKVQNKDWSFGLFYNYKVSRMLTKLSFQTEIHFQKQSNYFFNMMSRIYPTQTYRMDLYTDTKMIRIPLSVRYSYPIKKIEPYINIGFIVNFSTTNYSKALLESESSSHVIYTYISNDFGKKVKYTSYSGFVGLGLKYRVLNTKYLVIEARYIKGNGNSYNLDFDDRDAPKFKIEQDAPMFNLVIGLGI